MVKADLNFMPTGMRILYYSSNYIVKGAPNNRLAPNAKFGAQQMNSQCPLLLIACLPKKKGAQ